MSSEEYHVRFTYDLGRGIGEEFKYYPSRKLLQIEWKGIDGSGEVLNITAESTDETHRQLWEMTLPHRDYYDKDFAGSTPPPEEAPPGALDGKIYVPPDINQSVDVSETGDQPQQSMNGTTQTQHQPNVMQSGGMLPTNEQGVQVMAVLVDDWQEMRTRDKLKDCVIATMRSICESKLEKDSTELAIVNAQMEMIEELGVDG